MLTAALRQLISLVTLTASGMSGSYSLTALAIATPHLPLHSRTSRIAQLLEKQKMRAKQVAARQYVGS